jgi:predicted metal-dependent HD superfamily phosphohydrolase
MKLHRAINTTLCKLVEQYYAPESEGTYHNIKHIYDCLDTLLLHKEALQNEFPDIEWDLMLQSVVFHDACYQPGDNAAEIEACAVYKRAVRNPDVRVMRTILATSRNFNIMYKRPEEIIMHDLDYYCLVTMDSLKDAEYRIINEFSAAMGKSEDEVLEGRVKFYKELLAEAYEKGGSLFLTATFAKYNAKVIKNLETRLEELGEDLPSNPGSNITPAQGSLAD